MKAKLNNEVKEAIRHPYAWPGGYPLAVLMADGECMCISCVKKEFKYIAREFHTKCKNRQWAAEAVFINWEDADLQCANCNNKIESAYGEE